ncbi:hypothetical protein AM1_6092 [Acaryochloris marina MBIC11017]|uniref:Uncharacterized protein n=1 Tax=Acaryochloris marina (strain MBIC 11017) TaxID=329726 RepID=B0C3T7_ACAM1|nr:hypothetical protein AM1_6092 [Acaryochloris marina MBIC11017]
MESIQIGVAKLTGITPIAYRDQTLQLQTCVALLVGCSRFDALDVTHNLLRCCHHIKAAK